MVTVRASPVRTESGGKEGGDAGVSGGRSRWWGMSGPVAACSPHMQWRAATAHRHWQACLTHPPPYLFLSHSFKAEPSARRAARRRIRWRLLGHRRQVCAAAAAGLELEQRNVCEHGLGRRPLDLLLRLHFKRSAGWARSLCALSCLLPSQPFKVCLMRRNNGG